MAANLLPLVLTSPTAAFPLEAPALGLGLTNLDEVTINNVGSILEMLIKSEGSVKNVIDKFSSGCPPGAPPGRPCPPTSGP